MDSTSPSSDGLSLFSHCVRHCSDTECKLQMDTCLLKLDYSKSKTVFCLGLYENYQGGGSFFLSHIYILFQPWTKEI